MNPFRILKQLLKKTDTSNQLLTEIREGVANHAELVNRKMNVSIEQFEQVIHLQESQIALLKCLLSEKRADAILEGSQILLRPQMKKYSEESCKKAIASLPLIIAEKTYNTSHPDYDANLVRNYPGRFFNESSPTNNAVYHILKTMVTKQKKISEIPDHCWQEILDGAKEEIQQIPHSNKIFESMTYIEKYLSDLSNRYGAHYMPGWVNLEDALFLYWLVRILKPRTIVQTGVCNGLSSAFMTLGLVKNGADGKLYVIDLPAIFNPQDPAWTEKNRVYGFIIPEGKSSGWLVPDAYRDRLEVHIGDAKELLPPLVDRLDSIDMFYHDSDHSYHHMLFEFQEAKRKLSAGGVVIGDDISWNASLWDFADIHNVPAYNFKGAVGAAFF